MPETSQTVLRPARAPKRVVRTFSQPEIIHIQRSSPVPLMSRPLNMLPPRDLHIPVAYRTASAMVQNIIDRVDSVPAGRFVPGDNDRFSSNFSAITKPSNIYLQSLVSGSTVPVPGFKLPKQPIEAELTSEHSLEEATLQDHLMPIPMLTEKHHTNVNTGLSDEKAEEVRKRDGPNLLRPTKSVPRWILYLKELVAGFGLILWAAVVLCIIAYEPLGGENPDIYNLVLGFVILIVIFVQGTFSFVQQQKASNLLTSFANMMPSFTDTLRNGQWTSLNPAELVVGDIIRVREGDRLPADVRVLEMTDGKLDKSSLTGESEPVSLSIEPTDTNMYETRNLALFGTTVTDGTATGLVINTGEKTVMGKLAKTAAQTGSSKTGLQREIEYFMWIIVIMAIVTCLVVLLGYFLGIRLAHPNYLSVPEMITNCIAVVVALIPDGLPVAITAILTIVARKMFDNKLLPKKLTVVETLGSATVIASDKTGTLTKNQMTLSHVWIVSEDCQPSSDSVQQQQSIEQECVSIESNNEGRRGRIFNDLEQNLTGCKKFVHGNNNSSGVFSCPTMVYLLQSMALCNKACLQKETGIQSCSIYRGRKSIRGSNESRRRHKMSFVKRKFCGNPTEGALLAAADDFMDTNECRKRAPIVVEIPFSSRKKYHLTIHEVCDKQLFSSSLHCIASQSPCPEYNYIIIVKGAPEYVLNMCCKIVVNAAEVALSNSYADMCLNANEELACHGQRVLAFAYRRLPAAEYPVGFKFDVRDDGPFTSNLTFVGLAGIIDPPKDGVADAIIECHNAGIRVMMITGDQPTTAVAIAKLVNIVTHDEVKTIDDVVEQMSQSGNDSSAGSHHGSVHPNDNMAKKLAIIFKGSKKPSVLSEAVVISGQDCTAMTRAQWDYVLSHREIVFARTTPEQKLQIVRELQKRQEVVAVTGDGVNDAAALKAANLGIAMGICGSDVSKQAANMILLDDNFTTIVSGIREGRLLFDNLKKVICYLLPAGSFSEILPVFAAVFFGMPQPLSAFLMIVICVGTDMVGSLGIIHEGAEADIMRRPPRNSRTDRLIDRKTILFTYGFIGIIESAIAFFMYFLTMWIEGSIYPNELLFAYETWGQRSPHNLDARQLAHLSNLAQTSFFVSLVMTQLWNLLSVRTRSQSILRQKFNPNLVWYMLGEIVIMLLICYLPVCNNYLNTAPVEWYHFVVPAAMGFPILVADEIRKLLIRKYPKGLLSRIAW